MFLLQVTGMESHCRDTHLLTETWVFSWKIMVLIGVAEMSGKWGVLGASCG